jgi:hypothetical protein
MSKWQPIEGGPDETRPPWDGEPVLIFTDHNWTNRVHRAIWTDIHGWAVEDCKFGPFALRGYMNVTHWMPLPEPPK